jgi:hypothetical protein
VPAAAAAAGVVAVLARQDPVIVGQFRPPTRHEAADTLRDEALESCGKGAWVACKDKLDEATRLDPEGESEPRVQKARADLEGALHPGPNPPNDPGK